jgi:hypothetical protein
MVPVRISARSLASQCCESRRVQLPTFQVDFLDANSKRFGGPSSSFTYSVFVVSIFKVSLTAFSPLAIRPPGLIHFRATRGGQSQPGKMARRMRVFAAAALAAFAITAVAEEDTLESLGIAVDPTPTPQAVTEATDPGAFTPLYTLTDSNFSDFVSTSPIVLVEL